MIPDVLISKYLDSELSIEEDIEFRAMLAADPEAREAFDTAVLLHIAMRCEDDTTVPADVEARVLAFIDSAPMYARNAQVPHFTSSVRGLKARGVRAGRVMATAGLLLVLALPLGDQFLNLQGGLVQSERIESTDRATSQITSVNPIIANNAPVITDERTLDVVIVEDAHADASDDQRAQFVAPSLHSLFASSDLPISAVASGTAAKSKIMLVDDPSIDVLVTTSFSQSVTSPTAGAVTTVAAGIGYAVASNTFVGMELGSTQYTRTNETTGLVSDNGASAITVVPIATSARTDESGQLAKVTLESNTSPRYRTEVHTSLNPEGTLWGAAFVQHSVLKTGILSLNGRLGAGVGEDGMLTYGRMQAECNLFSGVSLTVGAEARYSPFRTGVVGGQPMARAYGTVISALYGLQVRL